MSGLAVRLLGPPEVERAGHLPRPCGSKTWALLAYLLLAERPPSRTRLAQLCFPEADDPRAALRWSLAELRRLLGDDADVGGDPVRLQLPADSIVDVHRVVDRAPGAGAVARLDGELLEGFSFPTSAPLELWLDCERQHLAAACRELLHDEIEHAHHHANHRRVAHLAGKLVVLSPFDAELAASPTDVPTAAS